MKKKCATVFFLLVGALLFIPAGVWAAPQLAEAPTLESLQQELRGGQQYRRIMAVESLGRRHTVQAVGILIETMLHDRSKPVRRAAQRQLAGIQDARIYPAIAAALQDPKRPLRLAAIDCLGLVRDPSAANLLLDAAARDPRDKELVRLALESLRELVYRLEPDPGFETRLLPYISHSDRRIRMTAVIVLGILGRPTVLPALLAAWDHADWKLKIRLADAFSSIGYIDPAGRLREALDSSHKKLVLHALYALAQIQSFSALEKIRALLLKRNDPHLAMAALYTLIEIPDADSIPVIMEIVKKRQEPSTLHWAAYALGQLGATAAGPELAGRLSHPAPLVRATAASALGEIRDLKTAPDLLLRVDDAHEAPEVRIAAMRALMSFGNTTAAASYWTLLTQDKLDLGARLTAAVALGSLQNPNDTARLADEVASTDYLRSVAAAVALGLQHDPRALPVLLQALEHGYPMIRRYAILGLEGLPSPESARALALTANDDRDEIVRILCASSLVAMGHTDYRVVLWNALEDKQADIRSEAILGLGRSADPLVRKQLQWYLRREPSVPVRQTIQRVLRERRP